MKKVRLKDIAKLANVSETTVSLVLNDAPSRISEKKKKEIKKIARDLNYRPNYVARSLSMNKTHTIGLIIPDIENPYFSSFSKYVEDILRKHDYLVFIVNSDDKVHNDRTLIRDLKERQVDGLIFCPSLESYKEQSQNKQQLESIGIPYVLVDRVYEDISTNQVSYDNEYGGYIATKYLIDKGCRNIACFTGSLMTYSGRKRYEGHVRALKEQQLYVGDENRYEGDYRFDTGYRFGQDVVKRHDLDGIFSCNDLMAYGLLKAMKENNVSQEHLEIVGYDNLKQSEMFGISLTSVFQDIEIMAQQACTQLLAQIEDKNFKQETLLKPVLAR